MYIHVYLTDRNIILLINENNVNNSYITYYTIKRDIMGY